ncbi:MAG: hypothetical protein WC551_01070 [Patescibacteria group bacterium]
MCQECKAKKVELFNRKMPSIEIQDADLEVTQVQVCVCPETGLPQFMYGCTAARTDCDDLNCEYSLENLKLRRMYWGAREHAESTTQNTVVWLEAHKRYLAKKLAAAVEQEALCQARAAEEQRFCQTVDQAQARLESALKRADELFRSGRKFDRGIYNEVVRQARMKRPTMRSDLEKWLKRAAAIAERAEAAATAQAA